MNLGGISVRPTSPDAKVKDSFVIDVAPVKSKTSQAERELCITEGCLLYGVGTTSKNLLRFAINVSPLLTCVISHALAKLGCLFVIADDTPDRQGHKPKSTSPDSSDQHAA